MGNQKKKRKKKAKAIRPKEKSEGYQLYYLLQLE